MDLPGFSRAHSGCVFEINELFNLLPLRRLVFAIDDTTDQAFLRDTMRDAWRRVKERSPNPRAGTGKVNLVQLDRELALEELRLVLCVAANAKADPPVSSPRPNADLCEFSW